jgi:hypothetical protein
LPTATARQFRCVVRQLDQFVINALTSVTLADYKASPMKHGQDVDLITARLISSGRIVLAS